MTPGTTAWNSGRDYVLAGYASAPAFGWPVSKGPTTGRPRLLPGAPGFGRS